MIVDTEEIDVINDEAIMKEGQCIGYVTSGGYAHHVQKSIAFGYLPTSVIKKVSPLTIVKGATNNLSWAILETLKILSNAITNNSRTIQ